MRILCAPDSFKATLAAPAVAAAMAAGARRRGAEPDCCPVADGGEGSLVALAAAVGAEILAVDVRGPLGEPVRAAVGIAAGKGLAIVELAQASGLGLVPPERRDPTRTSTYGAGQMIRYTLERGCRDVIVCIGGSATVDGGAGLAQALGVRFFDRAGCAIEEPLSGGRLLDVARVERAESWTRAAVRLRVACDVRNPLCGPAGAAAVYGPQKGATAAQILRLEEGLRHLAALLGDRGQCAGDGSAGGSGFGLRVLLGAQLERGIDLVLEAVGFEERCRPADLVLTGEGRLDAQTLEGKAVMGVAQAAARLGKRTIAIVGEHGPGAERCLRSHGGFLDASISLSERYGRERAMRDTAACIEEAVANL